MTFKDLKFEEHPLYPMFNQQARHDFPNGYGISVINGESAYCDENTYEVGIFKDGHLCYNTSLTSNVLSYQTEEDINKILIELENYEGISENMRSHFY